MIQNLLSRWRQLLTISVAMLLFALSSMGAQAQQAATLSGTILDPHGSALPNATVAVKNESSSVSRKTVAGADGRFTVTNLPAGTYTIEATAQGFAAATKGDLHLTAGQSLDVSLALSLGSLAQEVVVQGSPVNSIAAQLAPSQGMLDERSARSEISSAFIQEFTSPVADYGEVVQMVPGTFSVNSNGVGLGQSKTYFRGFSDGLYDITFDGIPWNDTNTPTHHSWAFFPSQWLGGVDFDRSPGSASTIGPTPFGGSINLLSQEMTSEQSIRGGISYGSFNTRLYDYDYNSGNFGGASRKSNLLVNIHRMSSDGYQTFNYQLRNAGSLKYQYRFNDKTTLTGFAGVIMLDTNTPDFNGPTRAQVAQFGKNFLMNNDPTSPYYYKYNFYHVPTDFEYVGIKSELGRGWHLDDKWYTYSYYNQQNLTKPSSKVTVINDKTCSTSSLPCGVDKLNSYRKYGNILTLSQTSEYGVFRTGMWYEWATTNRYQYPSDPRTWKDATLPNFHERFWTDSYQPFAEYEYHFDQNVSMTAGLKLAHYTQYLKQYADNGKTVGSLNGAPFVTHAVGYTSYMPSFDMNYRIKSNWSAYGQFATGSVIPPSSVFDVKSGGVLTLPKPQNSRTYQIGSVLKLHRLTLDADGYYIHFQNTYSSFTDTTTGEPVYYQTPDSVSKGFEAESNVYFGQGLSLYLNGTVGSSKYVGSDQWVASAPKNTEAIGLTYQQKYWDLGFFHKRIGEMYNDNGSVHQAVAIDPFSTTNAFINYTIRNGSHFDQTKFRLSFNNILDNKNITSVNPASTATSAPAAGDILQMLPGRSVMMSVTFGFAPKAR